MAGTAKARITLTQYGDYECPLSHEVYELIQTLRGAMSDDVRYVYRHFPLTKIHPHAERAAVAAEAAGLQGKFWEMHELLYRHQNHLADDDLRSYARRLGLNVNQFEADLASGPLQRRIKEDLRNGVRSEVDTTLNLFINGRRYSGEMKLKEIAMAVDRSA